MAATSGPATTAPSTIDACSPSSSSSSFSAPMPDMVAWVPGQAPSAAMGHEESPRLPCPPTPSASSGAGVSAAASAAAAPAAGEGQDSAAELGSEVTARLSGGGLSDESVAFAWEQLKHVREIMDGVATAHCQAQQGLGPVADLQPVLACIRRVDQILAQPGVPEVDRYQGDFIVGCGYQMLGDLVQALPRLLRVVDAPAGSISVSDHLSSILVVMPMLRKAHQWAAIIKTSDKAREVAGGVWADHTLPYMKGMAFQYLGRPSEAAACFEEAVVVNPGFHQAYVEYDKAMIVLRDFDACRRMAQKLVDHGGHWVNCWQRPDHFLPDPSVTSRPWHLPENFPLARALEANFHTILSELHAFRDGLWGLVGEAADRGNENSSHDSDLVVGGQWSEIVVLGDTAKSEANGAHFPETLSLLRRYPEVLQCSELLLGESLFSRLAPGTKLRPHCGPSNMRLTCHLGLEIPEGCEITCGGESRTWEVGKCIVFDDSYEHEVSHMGTEPRAVLLVNFWHPDIARERWPRLMREINGKKEGAKT